MRDPIAGTAMELARVTVMSPWGFASLAFLLAFALAALLLRGRLRATTSVAALAAALLCTFVALDVAGPKATAAQMRRDADANVTAAREALAWGFNVEVRTELDQAEAAVRRSGARDGLGRVQLTRGDLERLQGRLAEARTRYAAAAQQLTTLNHGEAATAFLRLGQMETALGDVPAARKALTQAIALYRRNEDSSGEAQAKLADGILARQGASLAEASALLREAAALFAGQNDLLGEARAMLELAQLSQMLVQATEADQRADLASGLFERANVTFGVALAHLVKADNLVDKEHAEAAENELNEAAAIIQSLPEPIAAAAHFLGLPAVEALRVRGDTDELDANIAAFPDYQIEARTLLNDIGVRIDRSRWDASRAH